MSRLIPAIYILVVLAAAGMMTFERMSKLLLGIHILVLLAAAVILAFVLEIRDARLGSASGDEPSDEKRDHRVLFRLSVVGGVAAVAVAAATIAGYSANPELTSSLLAWTRDHHPASLLFVGVLFYLVALLCGVKARQPVLLACLTLPGLIVMQLLIATSSFMYSGMAEAIVVTILAFFIDPGEWILFCIGMRQAMLLGKPGGNFTSSGLVRVFLISIAYVYGFIT
jgi:hypothetical protein